jgi:glycosyltransferase involved in cell wall biosynthesis
LKKKILVVSFSHARPVKREKLIALQERHDVLLIHPKDYPEPYEDDPSNPVPVVLVNYRFLFSKTPNPPRILMSLPIDVIRKFNPDIIYVEAELWCPTIWYLFLLQFLRITKARMIVHCASNQIVDGWKGLFRTIVYRMAGARLAMLVGCSMGVTEVNRRLCASKDLIYDTFPHIGPSPERFYPAQLSSKSDHFVFGYLGRLSEEKGINYLIEAFRSLPDSIHQKAYLDIYGDGPQRGDLEKQARGDDRIRFRGYVDAEAVPESIRKMNVFLLPSVRTKRDCEQWGLVLVEAMLSGLPIIGTDVGAIPEVLHGFGDIVPERNAGALVAAMTNFFSTYEQQLHRMMSGRDYAVQNYTGKAVGKRLMDRIESF